MNVTVPLGESAFTYEAYGFANETNTTTILGPLNVYDRYAGGEVYAVHRPTISVVNKYLTPIWYVIGFPSNLVAFGVWIQPRMRPSSGCYLAALAMGDLIFLMLQLIYELQETWGIRMMHYPVICESFPVVFLASQYLSPLLVLGFTTERYISICHPFEREKYCSTARAIKVIVGLICISLGLHLVQAYFWTYNYEQEQCVPRSNVIEGGTASVWTVWSWITELLVFGVVPLTILLLNILVIKEARKMSKSEETRLCLKRGHKSSAATVTLLAVSFFLIFTTLPVTVLYSMYFNFPEGKAEMTDEEIRRDATWQRHFTFFMVRTIIQELGMSHYACNFFIYVLTGKLFRRELKVQCFKMCCKSKLRQLRRKLYLKENAQSFALAAQSNTNGSVAHLWPNMSASSSWVREH